MCSLVTVGIENLSEIPQAEVPPCGKEVPGQKDDTLLSKEGEKRQEKGSLTKSVHLVV